MSGSNLDRAPRLREGVSLSQRGEAGSGIVVADHEGGRHFLIDAVEGRLLELLDGSRDLRDVHACLAGEYPASGLDAATVAQFVDRLETLGLLEGSSPPHRPATNSSLFYFKVPLGNPERFFCRVVEHCPFLFTRAFWTAAAALMGVALWTGAGSWTEIRHDGLRVHSLPGLLLLWASFFVIGTVHEMGHGLTSTYYGAPVKRWGLLFMYFLPCAFCDVSAAWTLPKKSQRLAIGAAGLAFQWVAGAVAVLLWRVTEPGVLPARVLATMAGTCGLASLLNLWPFMRLDGYYMLADALEIPNLRTRSVAQLKDRLGELLLGLRRSGHTGDPREERILGVYGIGVALWSGVMVWIMAHRLAHLFLGWWGALAAVSFVVAMRLGRGKRLAALALPFRAAGRKEGSVGEKRRRGVLPPLAVGAGLLLLVGRWELNISSPCRLEAAQRVPVRARVDGVLAEFRYREGDRARRGAMLGALDTFETRQQIEDLEARRRMVEAERLAIETRVPVVAAQTEQLTAETRAGLERARTDLGELAEDLPQRAWEAASRTEQAAAEEGQARAALREAGAAREAQSRLVSRLRDDYRCALAGDYPPELEARYERLRQCRADRELAERERHRATLLVDQGALSRQSLDQAGAAAEVRAREEQAARGQLKAAVKELREALEDARAELDRRRAAVAAAQAAAAAATAARETARRSERRVRAGCRPEQLAAAERQVEARGSAVTAAVARRGEVDARRQEVVAKRLEAERLDTQIAVLRRRLRQSVLVAPADGVITTPHVEERIGRQFHRGDPICVIEKPRLMSARIFVPEKEIGAVYVGAPVSLKVASFPERTFTGKVARIAPLAQRRGDTIACEVRIRIPNPHGDLRPGMTGWAKIACGRQPLGILLTRRLTHYARTEAWSWF